MTAGGVPAGSAAGTGPAADRRPGPASRRRGEAALPLERLDAVLFDLDGVLADTASQHGQAGAAVFTGQDDRCLAGGEPRTDGVRDVLADRRRIALPEGSPSGPPGLESAQAVAAEDARFAAIPGGGGPRPLAGSARVLRSLRAAGVATAAVSASCHCAEVLAAAGLDDLFGARVDGQAAAAMALPGKPDPATYLEAAARLGADPGRPAVVADGIAGVAAGGRGGLGLGPGPAGRGEAAAPRAAGADLVIGGGGELAGAGPGPLADGWHLTYRPASAAGEGMRQTLCTLGNGYLATRGARPGCTPPGAASATNTASSSPRGLAATWRRSRRSTPRKTRRSASPPPPPAGPHPKHQNSASCSPRIAPRGRGCGPAPRSRSTPPARRPGW